MNIAFNAYDAMPQGGLLTISLDAVEQDSKAMVELSIRDTGSGMDAATAARIFEPFFTTRRQEGGHGLGLTGVYALVDRLDGNIDVESSPGRGTRFTIELPRTSPPTPKEPEESSSSRDSPRVLLVDDNPQVLEVVGMMLTAMGCTVQSLDSGEAAIDYLAQSPEVDLLISDVIMPGLRGPDLLRQIRLSHPELPTILISGYSSALPSDFDDLQPLRHLAKPFGQEQLQELIATVLSHAESKKEPKR
jgi:CheY-like chemotaxis protein/anti-sigma regulatory factor (Ser/Thr protein kinase)